MDVRVSRDLIDIGIREIYNEGRSAESLFDEIKGLNPRPEYRLASTHGVFT